MQHNFHNIDLEKQDANRFGDFRPIGLTGACSNEISKIIANKMETIFER